MLHFPGSVSIWQQSPPSDANFLERGRAYCQRIQSLLPELDWCIDLNGKDQLQRFIWIGKNIHCLNSKLWQLTLTCSSCFLQNNYPLVQTWAFPLDWLVTEPSLVGLCGPQTEPKTLLIDVGQVHPDDWLGVVAHEFAHAMSGAGHGPDFQTVLTHLCIGLGLPTPATLSDEQTLKHWPPHRPYHQPGYWFGEASNQL